MIVSSGLTVLSKVCTSATLDAIVDWRSAVVVKRHLMLKMGPKYGSICGQVVAIWRIAIL